MFDIGSVLLLEARELILRFREGAPYSAERQTDEQNACKHDAKLQRGHHPRANRHAAGFKRGNFKLGQADATINFVEAFSYHPSDFVFEFEQFSQLLFELKEGFNICFVVISVSVNTPCSEEVIANQSG
mmetsp:Transcript_22093/g.16501  ORF Transcript_22093/g.16501 Transcript_22093/m.16501 type:complete len:129 (+) Transcript_22093:169-555(+)